MSYTTYVGLHGRLETIYVTHELYQRSSLSRLLFTYYGKVYLIWHLIGNVTVKDDIPSYIVTFLSAGADRHHP